MRKFNILLLSAVVSIFAACSGESHDKAGSSAEMTAAPAANGDFEKVFTEAEKAYKEATDMGAAWRDTDKILKKARAAAAGNEVGKATELAQEALTQSQLAMKQSKEQEQAGPHLF